MAVIILSIMSLPKFDIATTGCLAPERQFSYPPSKHICKPAERVLSAGIPLAAFM